MKTILAIIAWCVLMLSVFGLIAVLSHRFDVHTAANCPIKAPDSPQETRTVTYRVTAYCAGECCCGAYADGYTASGKPATGMIIAAPPEIPFGTNIYIVGWGIGEVQDRGGAIKGKRLDLLFPTHQQALNWGVKYREIEGL